MPLWPPSVDLAMETDRWEELEKITSDKNKKVLIKKNSQQITRSLCVQLYDVIVAKMTDSAAHSFICFNNDNSFSRS